MTNEKREFYDKLYVFALLSMSNAEYDDWYDRVSWPSSESHPEGLFDSVKEYREYFYFDYE